MKIIIKMLTLAHWAFLINAIPQLAAQDTLVVAEGDNDVFDLGVYSTSNRIGFEANNNWFSGFTAKENGHGFRALNNVSYGFYSSQHNSAGFYAEKNGNGFIADSSSGTGFVANHSTFRGFEANGSAFDGFLAHQNPVGFRAIDNTDVGFTAATNLVDGFRSSQNNRYGFMASHNTSHGFSSNINNGAGFTAVGNDNSGFRAIENSGHGFWAQINSGDGFRCESSGNHAGYFTNNDSTSFPAVYIAHGHDDSTDLKLGGQGRITSELQQIKIEAKLSVEDHTNAQIEFRRGIASGAVEQNASGGALRLQHPTVQDSTLIQLRTYGHSYFNGGHVGIGTASPTAQLHVNGYTKLGDQGPKIRMKELSGTTADEAQGLVQISHGIADPAKIIAVDIMLELIGGIFVAPNTHMASEDNLLLYNFFIENDKINVQNNSRDLGIFPNPVMPSPIRARPMRIVITYSE